LIKFFLTEARQIYDRLENKEPVRLKTLSKLKRELEYIIKINSGKHYDKLYTDRIERAKKYLYKINEVYNKLTVKLHE
jgi:hypothetical protein